MKQMQNKLCVLCECVCFVLVVLLNGRAKGKPVHVQQTKEKSQLSAITEPVSICWILLPIPLLLHKLIPLLSTQKKISGMDNPKSIKNALYIGGGQRVIATLIMSGQNAISLCSLRTHLLEMAQMRQLRYEDRFNFQRLFRNFTK